MDINQLLKHAIDQGASDVHLKVGNYPVVRVNGQLRPLDTDVRLDHESLVTMAATIMSANQRQRFKDAQELDLAYSVAGLGRFRCNVFQQRGTIGIVLRVIPMGVRTFDDLDLPPVLRTIADEQRGLVLVTGTTGSGKSTTLAAMIDHINNTRDTHIITIEDPIEYLHRDNISILNQREIGSDTRSFAHALRSALRQDPDVILVGEMRDMETIETALHAAETGHLVFSTLHTLDATETINRVISVFPPHQQKQIRLQLASVLKAAVSQRLIPRDRRRLARARGGSAHRHAVRARLHRGQGEDAPHQGGHRARAPRSTACRRSTSRSSACSRRAWSPTRRRCAGPRTSTSSSSRCRASPPPPNCPATRWLVRSSARSATAAPARAPEITRFGG